jgi:hypothetical protein
MDGCLQFMSACLLTNTEQDANNCMNPLSTQMNDNVRLMFSALQTRIAG